MVKKLLIVLLMFVCGMTSKAKAELLAHWPFDTSGADVIGSYNATLYGSGASIDSTNPKIGTGSLHLNNAGNWYAGQVRDYAKVDNAAGLFANITSEFTITMWIRGDDDMTNYSGYGRALFSGGTNTLPLSDSQQQNTLISCYPYSGAVTQSFYADNQWNPNWMLQNTNPLTPWRGVWQHWAFCKTVSGEKKTFLNGVQYMNTRGGGTSVAGILNFYIGGAWTGGYDGRIDDVAIWNEGLTAAQIQDVYLNGIPVTLFAKVPNPSNGATNIAPVVTISWQAGPQAVSHDVYLGTNEASVTNSTVSEPMGVYLGNQATVSKSVTLSPNTTYYWRVDERNSDSTITTGNLWYFTTKSYAIDDFESYANDAALQAKWAVTNATRTVEKQITHNYSKQSMQLDYNTALNPYYSKAVYDLGTAQNWTVNGLKMLTVYFHGSTNNSSEQIYVTLEDSAVHTATVIYPYPEDLTQSDLTVRWNEWNINLQSFAAGGVNLASVKKVTIGVGDSTPGGSSGSIYIDDIQLYQQRCVEEYGPTGDLNGDCRIDMNDVLIFAQDWMLKGEGSVTAASPNSAGLAAYYAFNETSGSTVGDSSGHGNNATVSPNNAWNSQGKFGGCLNFTGDYNTGAVVLVPDSVFSSITNQITISVWVNADTSSYQQMTIFDSNGTDATLWPEPKWEGTVGFAADGEGVYWPKAQPQDYKGAWHHYAVVKDADKGIQRLYRDGEVVAENLYAEALPAGIKNFIIGRSYTTDTRYGTDTFVGKLDDLKIYNYALSHAEILNLAQVSNFHQRVVSDADTYEDSNNEIIDFKDFAAIAKKWLQLQLWP